VETVVLERNAAGKAGGVGLVNAQARPAVAPEAGRDLALLSRHLYAEWVERVEDEGGLSCEYDVRGGLTVALSDAEEVELDRALDWQRTRSLPFEVLPAEEARAREPGLGGAVRAAFAFPDDGHLSPARLHRALGFAAARAGALVVTGTPAVALRAEAGRLSGVETPSGFLRAEAVVNAGGAWSAHLPGATAPPVSPLLLSTLVLDAASDPDRPTHFVASAGATLVPRRDGTVALAGPALAGGFDARVSAVEASRLLSRALALVPGAARWPLVSVEGSLGAASPDGVPLLGESAVPGCFFATGGGADAVLLAPAAALVVADLLTGRTPPLSPAPFSPARFDR